MLATKKTEVTSEIELMVWLLYGPPGIGKSTFAAEIQDMYFMTTEQGHRHLEIYNRQITDWKDFREAVKELKTPEGKRFKKICIDTVSNLYQMCQRYVCEKHGLEHPGDEGYGKGYDYVRDEFLLGIYNLSILNRGLILICHHKEKEVKGRGKVYTKFVPKLATPCWDVLSPFVDIIAYAGFDPDKTDRNRVLITEPREELEAKFRTERALRNPLPPVLPLDYKAVQKAWENRHEVRSAPAVRKVVSNQPRRIIK